MTVGDWIGVVALVLSVPLGIASSLLAPRVAAYFDQRKLAKTNQAKATALRHYEWVRALKDGERDRYAYYIFMAGLSTVLAVAAGTNVIAMMLVNLNMDNPLFMVWLVVVVACITFSLAFLVAGHETSRRVDLFDEYKAELETKWGPIDPPAKKGRRSRTPSA
jgi:hypothetical protein